MEDKLLKKAVLIKALTGIVLLAYVELHRLLWLFFRL